MLNDRQLRELNFISFPEQDLKGPNVRFSKGYSSFGYDVTLGPKLERISGVLVDPANFNDRTTMQMTKACIQPVFRSTIPDYVDLEPQSTYLGHSLEYFKMPQDVLGLCTGKSSYARCGLIIPATPLEPGWEGQLTLELVNPNKYKIRVYLYEGLMQINFFKGDRPDFTYSDRKGKYQNQNGIVYPKSQKCCERDHNSDGNCDRHPANKSSGPEPDSCDGVVAGGW
jgi:dCTP deaminase